MQYNQPFDQQSSPNAPYVDGNPSTGTAGSVPPAAAFEYPQREIVNFITDSGLTPSSSDLTQLTQAVQLDDVSFAADIGTVNALAVTLVPAPKTYTVGMTLRVKLANTNTGPATINVNGLGVVSVSRSNGAALASGDVVAGMVIELVFDGTTFQVVNYAGFSATTINNNTYTVGIPYATDTGAANSVTAAFSPAITSLTAGMTVEVLILHNNTGAATLKCNSLSAVAIVDSYGNALVANMLVASVIEQFYYDGTSFRLNRMHPRRYVWDAASPPGADVSLNVDEEARITFENVTAVPLKIASVPGLYRVEFTITASNSQNTDIGFGPNNVSANGTYTGFETMVIENSNPGSVGDWGESGIFAFDMYNATGNNDQGPFMLDMDISTVTAAKFIRSDGAIIGGPSMHSNFWTDTSTAWTSLGSLYVGANGLNSPFTGSNNATISGSALVKRVN